MATVAGPATVFFALGGSAHPPAVSGHANSVAGDVAPCCLQIVAAAPTASSWAPSDGQTSANSGPGELVSASRLRVVREDAPQALPPGKAPERGLQVKTILVARSISAIFPEIQSIGGVRPDALRWHSNGLALDVMIPKPWQPRRHSAWKSGRRVRAEERGSIRVARCNMAWHVLHTQRSARNWVRPLRPRPHHHHRRWLPHRRRNLRPLSLHAIRHFCGADDGNRTRVFSLGS
jgi:hypothetical protein